MRNNRGYRRLIAWQKANLLAHTVYDLSEQFPKHELFGLTSQMRRVVLSVCANIAEGYTRISKKDRKHFYQISNGSLSELEFFIDFAFERNYFDQEYYQKAVEQREESARVLNGLLKST